MSKVNQQDFDKLIELVGVIEVNGHEKRRSYS